MEIYRQMCILIMCLLLWIVTVNGNLQYIKALGKSLTQYVPYTKGYICKKINFILYNEYHPDGKEFQLYSNTHIKINFQKIMKILVHGWENDRNSPMPTTLKKEYEKSHNFNILVVDWGILTQTIFYPLPVTQVSTVGCCVAELLIKLYSNYSDNILNIHLVGFSLGAHVAAYIGRTLIQQNLTVSRITGLDPAEPLIENGLKSSDAAFVDVIHTSSNFLSTAEPVGDVDFYPNGGNSPQPKCLSFVSKIACSHSKSWQYYAHTINNPKKYLAFKCGSYKKFLHSSCYESTYMGEKVSEASSGIFYLTTF